MTFPKLFMRPRYLVLGIGQRTEINRWALARPSG